MKFENKGKWLKESEEKDSLVFDERTKMDFNEDEEIDGELSAEVESDEFIDELDRPEEEEDAIIMADEGCHKNETNEDFIKDIKEIIRYANAAYGKISGNKKKLDFWAKKYDATFSPIKDFSLSNIDNGSYPIKLTSNRLDHTILKNVLSDAIKSKGLTKQRSLGDLGNKYFIYESSQKNEGGIAHIRKLGSNSVWKGPMYKENEYMVALYNNDTDFRRGISFFSNPKNRTLSKQDAISYVKEKWPGYKIVIEESSQINESRNYHVGVKISVPDNMNNKDVENRLEEILDSKGFTVLDITATRT